jgi:hypothetical protein
MPPMEGNFHPELEILDDGKEVAAKGPISWENGVTGASLYVAIQQGKVAATGRTVNDLTKGTKEFFVTATVEGNGHLHVGDAIATGWAFLRGDGIQMYEWSVPVKLENH